jgi:mevalonate kinase
MKLKLFVAVLVVLPLCAQAQPKSAPKVTKADAQKIVKLISGDQAKLKVYCDMGKLSDEAQAAYEKKDTKKVEEISKKMEELGSQLGPEFAAFMEGLDNVDPNSQAAKDIDTEMEALDKLCTK